MTKANPKVDWYFSKGKWREEFAALRTIALSCGLEEDLKWGHPCYTLNSNNIILIHGFKDYCAYLFFKGVLLKDPKKLMVQQTANVQVARQIRFTNIDQIVKLKDVLKAYIKEAIEVEKSGVKAPMKKTGEFEMAGEFKHALEKNANLKKAFYALTPGRQRGYLLYFSSAKQVATREARIKKLSPKILKGKGLDD